jgi:chemosensory pili system protein ChpA (sensor histidine kinase/response regulator)
MAANPQTTFDIGPLSWVKAEIEHSLTEARTHLDKLAVDPGDAKAAKYVATHLHQVTGALSMVGLGAAARFNEEIEKLVETLENDPNARASAAQRIATTKSATVALSSYLDSLMSGEPDRPMMLAPTYVRLNQARGANDAAESDLFSPDLTLSVAMPEDTVALPKSDMMSEAVKQRRGMYQAGLLKLLRDKDMVGGAREMRNATLAIEALQVTSPSRSFWYAAGGFFDAVAANPAEAGALAVQLFGKIDQQIKLLIEGVQKVPEKLFRDILLVIGKSKAQTERLRKIRDLYRLEELLAVPETAVGSAGDEQIKSVVRALRDQVQSQKDNWLKFAGGNRSTLETYVTQAETLYRTAQQQPNKDVAQLVQALGAVGAHLRKTQSAASETQSIEVATAFLFLESSLENYFRLTADFAAQSATIVARLKGAMTGAQLPAIEAGANALMDDMTKRAQERMLMFQVGQEVQVNLTTVESALDSFFRDQQKTGELSTLPPLFSQVQGALTILELDEAAALNQLLRERVNQFASGAIKGAGEDAEAVAEGVSALGLYITALQQGTANPRDVLLPALIRFGLAEKPAEPEKTALKSPVTEGDIDVAKQKVQERYEEWKQQPEQTASRDHLREAVQELKIEAGLIADSKSVRQSDEALRAIEATFDPNKTGITAALSEIAPDKPTEAPAAQVVQLIDAPAAEIDQELLEIFLEEAGEVVGTIREHLGIIKASPHDKEAMTTIRRGFHTLKGSGRMVGLNDLGEVAWNCEQVMNKWLKDEKPPSAGLIGFVERAANAFGGWVSALQANGTTVIDGTELAHFAELLKNDKEPDFGPAAEVLSAETLSEPTPLLAEQGVVETASSEPFLEAAPVDAKSETPPSLLEGMLPIEVPAIAAPELAPPPALDIFDELPALAATETPVVDEAMQTAAVAEQVAPVVDAIQIESPVEPVPVLEALSAQQHLSVDDAPGEEAVEPPDVRVGDIMVPHALFNIYLGEADQHVATLDNEMSALEAKPMQAVSHDFMRAAHTLTSSSRTTGLDMIADVAHALEKWLQEAIEFPPEFNGHRLRVTRSATDALSSMVLGLHTHEPPTPRPDIVQDLMDLREALKQSKRTGEGTHIKMPGMQGDVLTPVDELPMATSDTALSFFDEPVAAEFIAPQIDAPAPVEPPPLPMREEVSFDLPAATPTLPPEPVFEEPDVEPEPLAATAAPAAPGFDPGLVFGAATAATVATAAAAFVAREEAPATVPEAPAQELVAEVAVSSEPAPFVETPVDLPPVQVETVATFAPSAPPPLPLSQPQALATPAETPVAAPSIVETKPVVVEAGKDRRTMTDDVDHDLLPIFLEEAKEIIPQVGDSLRTWRNAPGNHAPVTELARHLHTLKGSARMAGLMRLGELAHVIEERIIKMDQTPEPVAAKFEEVDEGLDRFNAAIDRLAAGDFSTPPIEIPAITDVSQDLPAPLAMMAAARAEIIAEGEKLEGRERQSLLRVNADIIDRFVNEAGELSIARSRIDQEMLTFKQSLVELTDNISRMKSQLREIEIQAESQIQSRLKEAEEHGESFDPLEFDRFSRTQELTRFLAESLNDVVTLQISLQKNIDETEAALLQQARLNRDLQQGLMGVRLVPLGNLQERFYRLLRQTAKELDKKANLEFRGTRVEIDRSVLEKITAPFEHLLRNAVAHGLEMPADRIAKGKPEIGEITIDAQQVGNEVVLTLADDGAGLNFPRIREKAIQQGLLEPDAEVNEAQLTQFIFMAGFSTAQEVSQIAGRGVGMDVVRNEIVSLGGRIDIASTPGKGTTFTIALPLTLAVTQAVMVMVGETMYAIPSVMIEQVQEYKGKRYEPFLELSEIDWKGNKYPLRSMEALLGGQPTVSAVRKANVILAKSGQQRAAVQVDSIIGNREIVVKTIGPQLARLVGVAGATMLGTGQIVLIMNPVQLVFHETATVSIQSDASAAGATSGTTALAIDSGTGTATTAFDPGTFETTAEPVVEALKTQSLAEAIAASAPASDETAAAVLKRTIPLVMVVDDSLTVRKITSRMLTREGFEVATAKDGVDGLQQLQDIEPDIILLDIEMPRMDGFEFARNVRLDAKTKGIPIIMITSRTADKHRNHAIELGVNEYMGKPYQEEQLLGLIRQYTRHVTAA